MANRPRKEGKWRIGEEEVAEVDSFVYLGLEFGKGPTFKEMKKRVKSKIEGRVRKVEMLSTFGLGTKEGLRIWQLVVMESGSEVWASEEAMGRFGKG